MLPFIPKLNQWSQKIAGISARASRRSPLLLSFLMAASLCLLVPNTSLAESGKKPTKKEESSKSKGKKKGAKKSDFEKVEEPHSVGADKRISEKEFQEEANQAGQVDAVLVLDASRSMQRTDSKRLRDQAAKLFIRFLGNGDRAAIIEFDREARLSRPLTDVSPSSLPDLDKAIEGVSVEGAFTDLEVGLAEAFKLLSENGRKDAAKTIVLLSDGKMDPHPSRGTSAELTTKVLETELAEFKRKNIKLYTVAFSEESDKDLLAKFAKEGGGLNWYASDASTIHKKFSELFLTLKRPQVVPLEGEGFEVDPSVQEATFYITRHDVATVVTLIDPRGTEISSKNIPPGIKWFSGELFDVVTVTKPFPGRWSVKDLETAEGFATLLSDIKLQVRWPQSNFNVGDHVIVYARLTNEGEEVVKSGIEEITFYTYKIVNSETGATLESGSLNDKGEDGDSKKGDGIYTGTLELAHEGEFQGLFAVTSPTFSRQQRISFAVSSAPISLHVVPADSFSGTAERIEAVLGGEPSSYRNLKVQLVAKKKGAEKPVGITLKAKEDKPNLFEVPTEKLPAGEYELTVRVQAYDLKHKPITGSSETLPYTVQPKAGEKVVEEGEIEDIVEGTVDTGDTDEHGEAEAVETHSDLIPGIVGIVLALCWIGGLGFWGLKKVSVKKSQVESRAAYIMPEELSQRIEAIRSAASESKRRATAKDREVFLLVPDALGPQEVEEAPEAAPEGAAEAEAKTPAEEEDEQAAT